MPLRIAHLSVWFGTALVVTVLAAAASRAHAQDLEPRAYANTPVGMNFLIAGYGVSGLRFPPSLWCDRHPHPGASTILGEQRHITAFTEVAHETTTGCAPAHYLRPRGRPSSVPMRGGHRPCGARGEWV